MMALLTSLDWVYVAAGGFLAAAGVLLAAWALFRDRSRGRRRCPHCWYDMTGVPGLVCPECGRDAKREERLFRTRSRWRWMPVAGMLVISAWVVWQVPAFQSDGIWAVVPRPVLIAMIPHVERDGARIWPAPPTTLMEQIESRLFESEWQLKRLWWPERWWLANRARRAVVAQGSPDYTQALGARALVLTRNDPLSRIPDERKGPVILARTGMTYAHARTYLERGMTKGSIGIRDETHFITALARNGERRFRFEYIGGHPHQQHLSIRYAIWAHDDDVRSWWSITPRVQTNLSLPMALAGATGVSKGNAHRIPRVLLPEIDGRSFFTDLLDVRFEGIESLPEPSHLDDRDCFRIVAQGMGDVYTIWIDAQRFLLLRIERAGQFPNYTIYDPEIDIEIDDSWFEFDPDHPERSPLQDPDPPG